MSSPPTRLAKPTELAVRIAIKDHLPPYSNLYRRIISFIPIKGVSFFRYVVKKTLSTFHIFARAYNGRFSVHAFSNKYQLKFDLNVTLLLQRTSHLHGKLFAVVGLVHQANPYRSPASLS